MDNCVSILANCVPQNVPNAIDGLRRFCSENEKAFSLIHLDVSHRKSFIDVILNTLTKEELGLELIALAISSLRILSRDKDGLGSLSSEGAISRLLSLAELLREEVKCEHRASDDRDDGLDRLITRTDVVVEALKCLCNIVYHSAVARQYCLNLQCVQAILARVRTFFDNTLLTFEVKYFDMRFLFLLTALENTARVEVVASKGFCSLTHALDICIPGKEQRKICHETKVRDGCGQVAGAKLQALSILDRYETPFRKNMIRDLFVRVFL